MWWSILVFLAKVWLVCIILFAVIMVLGIGFIFFLCLFADEIPPCKGDCDKCEPITKQYCDKGDFNNKYLLT